MQIISCIPEANKFWIACNKEEAEEWFIPLLDESGLECLNNWFQLYEDRKSNIDHGKEYEQIIKDMMGVKEIAYAYFCVSRDMSDCYAEVAHHPFHQLWNGYSPFRRCDPIDISSPEELKDVVLTYKGKTLDQYDDVDLCY